MKKLIALMLALVLGVFACAVAEDTEVTETTEAVEEVAAVETEEVVEPDYTIALGETMELIVEEAQAENAQAVWTSADETIVTVDENGVAAALNAGETVVTVAVTTTTMETVEKTVTETVETTDETTGETVSEDVEKTVTEEVEKTETTEIELTVAVESAQCPGCGADYVNAEEYKAHVQIAVCGAEGHYVCDGRDHETILDEFCQNENPHRICQAGEATHVCESCGETYACEDSGSHATCLACGNAWCYKDNGNHFTPACGKIEHRPCVSDHYNKADHYRCKYCNERLCNGGKHGLGKCVAAPEAE